MKKKIWVLSAQSTDLSSVQAIARNWAQIYSDLDPDQFDVCVIQINSCGEFLGHREKLLECKLAPPDFIVIVHHTIIDNIFFRALLLLEHKKTRFIFHVVGNFVRYGESWHDLARSLQQRRAQFVVASQCYFELLSHFIDQGNLGLAPFALLQSPKKNRSAPQGQLRVIYAGRYHEQKNVTRAIELLSAFAESEKTRIDFRLATYFDDFNPTTIDEDHLLGKQFKKFKNTVERSSAYLKVQVLPFQTKDELDQLLADSDCFFSLSTFLDEDFGLAVGEALLQGTPCIVSDWGGYKDFCRMFPEGCFGLKIIKREEDLYVNVENLKKYMEKIRAFDEGARTHLRQRAIVNLGHEKSKEAVLEIMKKDTIFNGSMGGLSAFSKELRKDNRSVKFDDVYQSFWSNR